MDEIRIRGLKVFAHHGVYPEENEKGQSFPIHASLFLDLHPAGLTDELKDTVNYGAVCRFLSEHFREKTCKLLEHAAERLTEELLLAFPLISYAEIEVEKPEAPIPFPFETVSVTVKRGWNRAYVALGANLGDPKGQIEEALSQLNKDPKLRIINTSSLITTKPYGGVEQPDFVNGACEVETLYTPEELLSALLSEESRQGRKREIHWGPRTLDLDLLFYEKRGREGYTQELRNTEFLRLPHPDLQNRDFVLNPMAQLRPDLTHPVLGKSILILKEELTA